MVWCNKPSACITEDFPDAFAPESSVKGRSGNINKAKHLKCRKSIRVSTQNLPECFMSHPEPALYPSGIARSVGDCSLELIDLQ